MPACMAIFVLLAAQGSLPSWRCETEGLGIFLVGEHDSDTMHGILYGSALRDVMVSNPRINAVPIACGSNDGEDDIAWVCSGMGRDARFVAHVSTPKESKAHTASVRFLASDAMPDRVWLDLRCDDEPKYPSNLSHDCFLDHDCKDTRLTCINGVCRLR